MLSGSSRLDFTTHRAPYVAGLGWAPTGKDWLVVADVRARTSRDDTPTIEGKDQGIVRARTAGPGALVLTVEGVPAPARTVGAATTTEKARTLPTAAYLVDEADSVTVTLRFTQRLTVDPTDDDAASVTSPVDATDAHSEVVGPTT